jgi:hypothetical protein
VKRGKEESGKGIKIRVIMVKKCSHKWEGGV